MLPVESVSAEIVESLEHSDVILSAPPGAGKSTFLPLALLRASAFQTGKIVMLQPRRVAARSIAHYLAEQLGEPVGKTVGFRVRGETKTSNQTRLEIITEGLLTRMLQDDPSLEGISLVIFDEFHERNVHADFALGLCLEVQQALRDDLRLMVMSATLHINPLAALMPEAKHIESEGRQFPIEFHYLPLKQGQELIAGTANATRQALLNHSGSVLVFLPGTGEIKKLVELLSDIAEAVDIFPLYGDLSLKEQQKAIQPSASGRRKLVIATNIAETSLTIEGISVVVDSGKEKAAQFDIARGVMQLQTRWISQASAVQRAGRAGRLGPGVCYRLWSSEYHQRLTPHIQAQIFDSDLCPFVLEAAAWGTDIRQLPLLDVPTDAQVNQANDVLRRLNAIEANGHITAHGRKLVSMGSHPRTSHMMTMASISGAEIGWLACLIGAVLERPVVHLLKQNVSMENQIQWLEKHPSHALWRVASNWARRNKLGGKPSALIPYMSHIAEILLRAFPDYVAKSRGKGRYKLANGSGCVLPSEDPLAGARYLVVGQQVLTQGADARIGLANPVHESEIERVLGDSIVSRTQCNIDNDSHKMTVVHQRCLGQVVLSETPAPLPEGERRIAMWCDYIRQQGLSVLRFPDTVKTWCQRVSMAKTMDDTTWPDVSESALLDTLETWLGPYLHDIASVQQLRALNWLEVVQSMLDWHLQKQLDALLPGRLKVPTGNQHQLRYEGDGKVVLSVRMQEMYGLEDSPRIGNGSIPVVVELLSPAGRPLQTTSDLRGFWQGSYKEVQKEMKGRYPKHYWPDDPASATATDKTKKRMGQTTRE